MSLTAFIIIVLLAAMVWKIAKGVRLEKNDRDRAHWQRERERAGFDDHSKDWRFPL